MARGRLADHRAHPELLDRVVAGAAIWIAVTPTVVQSIAGQMLELDYRLGVLLAALIGFGPALFLAGMVTPVAVKLCVPDLDHVGRSSGSVYACSTAGGIVGALGAGFLLFPFVSVSRICHIMGILLLVLAASRSLSRSRRPVLAALPPVALLLMGLAAPEALLPKSAWEDGPFRIIENTPSYYGAVRVLEYKGHRMLTIDGMCHNAQTLDDRLSAMPHVWFFGALPYLRPGAERALLIGLGGGDMVGLLKDFGIRTSAVEIDPAVAQAAFAHFGLKEQDVSVTVGDGRYYLRSSREQFDFVIVDAFMGGMVPSHLFSREAFQEMKLRLKPGGLVAFNIAVIGPESKLMDDIVETIRAVFPRMILVTTARQPDQLGNLIVFASDSPIAFPDRWYPEPRNARVKAVLATLPSFVVDHRRLHGTIVTDDLNPIESYSVETEIALRMDTRAFLPQSLLEP